MCFTCDVTRLYWSTNILLLWLSSFFSLLGYETADLSAQICNLNKSLFCLFVLFLPSLIQTGHGRRSAFLWICFCWRLLSIHPFRNLSFFTAQWFPSFIQKKLFYVICWSFIHINNITEIYFSFIRIIGTNCNIVILK